MAKSVRDINFIVDIFLIDNDHLYIEELLVMVLNIVQIVKRNNM
jgi:hypothetical protein